MDALLAKEAKARFFQQLDDLDLLDDRYDELRPEAGRSSQNPCSLPPPRCLPMTKPSSQVRLSSPGQGGERKSGSGTQTEKDIGMISPPGRFGRRYGATQAGGTIPETKTSSETRSIHNGHLSGARPPGQVQPVQTRNAENPTTKVTDVSNLYLRKRQLAPRFRKGPVPLDQQMFQGLIFFFIPNCDIAESHRMFMHNSVRYGAVWANEWCEEITHVIVLDGLGVVEASKHVSLEKLPLGTFLVNQTWLQESFSLQAPKEVHWKRFQVPGSDSLRRPAKRPRTNDEPPFRLKLGPGTASRDELRASPSCPQAMASETTRSGDTAREDARIVSVDDLDGAIEEVKALGDLPLNPSFYSDADPTPDTGFDPALELVESSPRHARNNTGFACMGKVQRKDGNANTRTIELLQQLAHYYDRTGDHWRTTAYRKAIAALRTQTQPIRTKSEALAIRGIGERIATKIEEIVRTNQLRRLDCARLDSHDQLLQLFMGVYDAGYPTASKWIAQGHRTLQELLQNGDLTPNQKIGIEHYDDFQRRIPRAEVAQHATIVEKALKTVDPQLRMVVGGSFRRGLADSGDIDCIITKDGATLEQLRTIVIGKAVLHLEAQGFLRATLAAGRVRGSGSTWHGASALPGSQVWRRIDLLLVPGAEYGAALLYFTGNDIYNRSMRLLASRKGMRLNQHGLYTDVMRGPRREHITDGRLLESRSERRIFDLLGVPYRRPEDRNC